MFSIFPSLTVATLFLLSSLWALPADAKSNVPIIVGLDADLSAGSARSGIAIRRGAEIAIAELNARGGVLGRPLQLMALDHRGNPTRGADNILQFAETENLVAVMGGLHTPVVLHELKLIHQHKLIYLVPWAAGTSVIQNGYNPNFVFRVSVRDEYAGAYLVKQALKRGYKRVALLLEKTGWGRSNERAIKVALERAGLAPAGVSWFHWGTVDMQPALSTLDPHKPDVILLVANAPEGRAVIEAMVKSPSAKRLPILSHWGITGGRFFSEIKDTLPEVDLSFLQTFSFLAPPHPERAKPVLNAYLARYDDANTARDIFAPVGTAHAYDLIHLLAVAIENARSTEAATVRNALENLPLHKGLVRDYAPAFTTTMHDALTEDDFTLSRFDRDGVIVPIQ